MSRADSTRQVQDMDFLAGGGEMGALIRSVDWAKTPIGPVASWSPALRMMVRFLLANRFPLLLWWGPHYVQIYNDAYRPIPGTKHPASMGQPASECWPEIWHVIGPLIDTPFSGGPATWMDDICLEVNRHGFVEETHFTIAYSPVPDETAPRGIGGVLATVHEITEKVVGGRRVLALRDLGSRPTVSQTAEEACAVAAKTLSTYDKDVPFCLLYLLDADSRRARLAGSGGLHAGEAISPAVADTGAADTGAWPFAEAKRTEAVQVVPRLSSRFAWVPPGPWPDPPDAAVVVPIPTNRAHELAGFLVAGISARLEFDDAYRGFLELATVQIATAIANARAYEEERRRAEALAEIDRAKTAFFSNVSHEFRTPLTLMLGPIEDLLAGAHGAMPAPQREQLKLLHRSALRLQKLVNSLLDFSRIEAGRMKACYEPADLAALTCDLASVFRSAVERAGLTLTIDCPPLPGPVYVDRDMWEKIVLNLLSNAVKFTFAGGIEVSLRSAGGSAVLRVKDTGVGVAPEELPRLFERFHRVEGVRARTHEGSGIGLALVQELVKLHGGSIRVESALGTGTTFTVTVPQGPGHLPRDRVGAPRDMASTSLGAAPFIEEAVRWLPGGAEATGAATVPQAAPDATAAPAARKDKATERVLLADDNADMREYLLRLLRQRWDVEAASDGAAALAAVRERPPDLVLTDVMMPNMDGFDLLGELRADPRLRAIPVIMLSARAGEESKIEGLHAGADDYLIKPFSARELIARVETHLQISRLRAAEALAYRKLEEEHAAAVQARRRAEDAVRMRDDFLSIASHELRTPLAAISLQIDTALRVLSRGDANAAQRVLGKIEMARRTADRLERLIAGLLDVTRIGDGRLELRLEDVDLMDVVGEVCERLQEQAARAGSSIAMSADGAIMGRWDAMRLDEIVTNLVGNAIKYGAGKPIEVTAESSADRARVVVRDQGIGLSPEDQERIFGRFERAVSSRHYGGFGLGLWIARQMAEAMGGEIRVESRAGEGAAFIVDLPRRPPVPLSSVPKSR